MIVTIEATALMALVLELFMYIPLNTGSWSSVVKKSVPGAGIMDPGSNQDLMPTGQPKTIKLK